MTFNTHWPALVRRFYSYGLEKNKDQINKDIYRDFEEATVKVCACTCTCTCAYTHKHTHIHTRAHTRAHTRTYTHAHILMLAT